MKQSTTSKLRGKSSSRRTRKPAGDTANKATTDKFEQEEMGIAPKE